MDTLIPNFSGRRDGGADHIKALIEYRWTLHTAHIDAWENHQDYLADLEAELDVADALEAEQAAAYLREPLCHDDYDRR